VNLATLISLGAAFLQLGAGLVFLAIAGAPGWAKARLFAMLALTAGLYSAVDVAFSLHSVSTQTILLLGPINFFLATLHSSTWVVYAFAEPERPWQTLRHRYRVVVALTLLWGAMALLPHTVIRTSIRTVEVAWLGVTYRQPETSPFGDFLSVWFLLVLTLPLGRFIGDALRREPGAGVKIGGFVFFFFSMVMEALVADGVVQFLSLSDIGFLAIVGVVLIEALRQITGDAQRLQALGVQLEAQVEVRTRERDDALGALAHAERLAALGQLAAGVGHEVNNPLAVVKASVEFLLEPSGTASEREEALEDALSGVERIRRVVKDLRVYSLPSTESQSAVEIPDALRSALKVAAHRLRHVATLKEELAPTQPVLAEPVRLSQVFTNLLVNAAQSFEGMDGSAEHVVTLRAFMSGPREVCVEVRDNGVGIPEASLRRLSEPYFSSRTSRGGSGLGLFVTRGIVTACRGRLEFDSQVGKGTVARVFLPTVERSHDSAPSLGVVPSPPLRTESTRHRVLVVDDEPAIVRIVTRLLREYDVQAAFSADEGLARIAVEGPFDVILCDLMMPGRTGIDVHAELRRSDPNLAGKMVFMTGGAVTPATAAFLERDDIVHVHKPFEAEALSAILSKVIAGTAPSALAS
jgi:signal transduction histidine kinase/CheY-like chemotaxis protein